MTYDPERVQALLRGMTPTRALGLATQLAYHDCYPSLLADETQWLMNAIALMNQLSAWERANLLYAVRDLADERLTEMARAATSVARNNDDAKQEGP